MFTNNEGALVGTVVRGPVPETIRAIDPLVDPDYTDAFEVDVSALPSRTPEQWARATFEGASAPMRWFLLASWRVGLGLRLGPRHSPDHVLGWSIIDRSADSAVLESRSWFLYCHLIFRTESRPDATTAIFSSSVRYERRIGALIWPPAAILHRRIVPALLRRATS